ncbi:MAG: YfhO family protein [Chloroflexi bacterium]|nr:YfhO family protein [Chloroflexota bacterium]MCY3584001.1 YfhO family protein [Chloroflexota bacterium]MCY3716663.1 YfhO family protein [Chloroflexota bacterium]MDE2649389.1 YfhO family protein [Chloroflexota bacterium]MXV92448.1 YfhO family protein [Chloroflexota bacterium]
MSSLRRLGKNVDAQAIGALIVLWLFFFWRLFTPVAEDQASLAKGDFSGQFVAFGGYQYQRMTQGEIPLWNPYNNGGLPFIADTQAAVFYPPRWLTIGLSYHLGGWTYNSLQLEMAFHVLMGSLLMYGFMRRLTRGSAYSPLAALIAALVIGYGGYLTGYPPLQLAVLEAAIWFPLMALGILEATRGASLSPQFLALAGVGLGMSWLAGHPQTSFLLTYLSGAYLAYRCYALRLGWRRFFLSMALFAAVSFGVTAVTMLPGLEYLQYTSRSGLGFAAKGHGFPFQDIAQFVFPGSVSQWSPLYVGLPALFFIAVALRQGPRESRFWLAVALLSLLHSLGDKGVLYDLTYNFVPGLRYFRGQERAAVLVAYSLATLTGLGMATLANMPNHAQRLRMLRYWLRFTCLLAAIALAVLVAWTVDSRAWGGFVEVAARSAIVAAAAYIVLSRFAATPKIATFQVALVTLIVFELFAVNMDHPANFDDKPHNEQLSMRAPRLVQQALDDSNGGQPFRVDGFRGLRENNGSLYGLMDMRGISPLFLNWVGRLVFIDYVENPLAWELFAVNYVYSEKAQLSVETTIIDEGHDSLGAIYLHKLTDPRPFVMLMSDVAVANNNEWMMEYMGDIRFDEREKIVMQRAPRLPLPATASGQATVLSFAPEEIIIGVDSPDNTVLSVSLPDYVGWRARINDEPTEIIRAYAALMALEIPAGQHIITLSFAPTSYALGAAISALTWLCLCLLWLAGLRRR